MVGVGRNEFYKYILSQDDLDLVVSVTPTCGDPGNIINVFIWMTSFLSISLDIYISLTQHYPNKKNFTWSQTAFGPGEEYSLSKQLLFVITFCTTSQIPWPFSELISSSTAAAQSSKGFAPSTSVCTASRTAHFRWLFTPMKASLPRSLCSSNILKAVSLSLFYFRVD